MGLILNEIYLSNLMFTFAGNCINACGSASKYVKFSCIIFINKNVCPLERLVFSEIYHLNMHFIYPIILAFLVQIVGG